jgi:hypothetical protein
MMPRSLARLVVGPSVLAIRTFPLLVALCVMVFPAYKGMALGYVPLAVGALAAGWLLRAKCVPAVLGRPGIVALYVLPLVLQAVLLLTFRPEPWFDGLYVYRHAVELLNSGRMDPMTYYPPAMTWWYAGWFWRMGASVPLAQLSQLPLSAGVTWATLQLAREVAGAEGTSRRIALATAWYPTFLGYVLTTPYYHYLYTLLTVLMVWLLLRCWNRAWTPAGMVLAGLCAGLGALTKAVQLVAPLQLGCWLLIMMCANRWNAATVRRWMLGAGLFVVGMMLVLLPWMMRNWRTFHDLVPVCTSGGLVLYSANHPDSNGLYSDGPDKVALATPADMLAHSRWCADQAKTFMRDEPGLFAHLVWRKFLHTWGSEATFTELINWRGQTTPAIKRGFSFLFLAGWAAVVFFWVVCAGRMIRGREPLTAFEVLVGVLILSNALIYVVFEGGDRHHLPLVPLILVLVGGLRGAAACTPHALPRRA